MLIPIDKSKGLTVTDDEVEETTFSDLGLVENQIEEFLRKNIEVVFEDETLLIVGQQVINAARGRSDLIAVDEDGSIVLIEIKRDVADIRIRHEPFEFQAVRYAASLATVVGVDDLVSRVFAKCIEDHSGEFELGDLTCAERGKRLVADFLHQNNAARTFNQKQRIILIASDFDDQTLSAVAWLIKNRVDISAFRITPKKFQDHLFLEASIVLPPDSLESFYVDITQSTKSTPARRNDGKVRRNLPRMKALMDWGLLSRGDTLVIVNHSGSDAQVLDHATVKYKDDNLTFNEWGSKVTGWSSICIYEWAKKKDGTKTLAELREAKMGEMERSQEEVPRDE
jgi:hypothetical protein